MAKTRGADSKREPQTKARGKGKEERGKRKEERGKRKEERGKRKEEIIADDSRIILK
ncbi:MAG: hypothetical protein NTZ53_13990 [Cyanobacteria bacterium]|nr:hypothetical protein [Cyanobacteriota bacterium]